jgi:hypothetical protein
VAGPKEAASSSLAEVTQGSSTWKKAALGDKQCDNQHSAPIFYVEVQED